MKASRSITWPAAAMAWCDRHEKPLPGARDPNYLTPAEAHDNPWAVALRTPDKSPVSDAPPLRMHFDIHGKRDGNGDGDVDVGVGACRVQYGDAAADKVAACVHGALRAALDTGGASGFHVDPQPRLQGCWKTVPRLSLSMVSAAMGHVPVQLELTYRLRRELGRSRALSRRFALALASCECVCAAACANESDQ